MFQTIWQIIQNAVTRRLVGIDKGDIEHLRADLRFRLAIVEYAYFGKSGKRVARRLAELKSLLGDKATHRYLRSLDPDLRVQFVERFQSSRRALMSQEVGRNMDHNVSRDAAQDANQVGRQPADPSITTSGAGPVFSDPNATGSNVVSIQAAVRRNTAMATEPESEPVSKEPEDDSAEVEPSQRPADSSD